MKTFDLLSTTATGGCAAKLPAKALNEALSEVPKIRDSRILVDIENHDDAGVYKLNETTALIHTTDFFPPVCSDPYSYGAIAAANAMSDVYAMGGEVLNVLNIVAFPAQLPLSILKDILKGGIEKVMEAGAVVMGGHTIEDNTIKYGMAVTGSVHPNKIITNTAAQPSDVLLLTKPLGTGIIMAGHKIGEAGESQLQNVIDSMTQLNKGAAEAMQKYHVKSATDVTGFGLLGHALKMAIGSGVTMEIQAHKIPFFEGCLQLSELGCLPGACFRNSDYVKPDCHYEKNIAYEMKMLLNDAQTSGGMLISSPPEAVYELIRELINAGYPHTTPIGKVIRKKTTPLIIT